MSQLSSLCSSFITVGPSDSDTSRYEDPTEHTCLSQVFNDAELYLSCLQQARQVNQNDFKPLTLRVSKKNGISESLYYFFNKQIYFSKAQVSIVFKDGKQGLKKYLLVDCEKSLFHQPQSPFAKHLINHQLAASIGIAPIAYALDPNDANCGFLIKISDQVQLNDFLNGTLLDLDKKLSIARGMVHNLDALHSQLDISHLQICPSAILVEEKSDGKIRVEFNNFSNSSSVDLMKMSFQTGKYMPPEALFDVYIQPQERMALDYSSKHLDLYNLGQTLYYLFQGNHYQDDFTDYIRHPLRANALKKNLLQVESLDDYTLILDDTVRDFLQFKFSMDQENIIEAIRGLLRTHPNQRISLKSAAEFL